MAKTQRVMWTALPNGLVPSSGGKKLRLSVFVSPRLEDDVSPGRLDHFPDFSNGPGVNWASKVNDMSFTVEVMNNLTPDLADVPTPVGTYTAVSSASPQLWDLMFKPSTAVTYKRQLIPSLKVNSFSVPAVIKQIQDQYVAVSANPVLVSKLPAVDKMVTPTGLLTSPIMRLLPSIMRPPSVRVIALSAEGDPAFKEFEEFHKPFDSPPAGGVEAQATVGQAKPMATRHHMDFHTALSSLGEFPALLSGLGVVINLEIPYDNKLRTGKRLRVVPTSVPAGSASPWTAYDLVPGVLTTAGYLSAKSFASRPKTSDLKSGYMVMRTPSTPSKSPVTIATVDVDFTGMALKATAVSAAKQINEVLQAKGTSASSVKATAFTPGVIADVTRPIAGTVSPSTTYQPMGLPGLGPSTLSLSRNSLGTKFKAEIAALASKDELLQQNKDKLILNYAEDLSRGFRVDVWDSITKKWHRLCARKGAYTIADAAIRFKSGAATMDADGAATLADEGWIQTAVISDPNTTTGNDIPNEVWLHEHMFDWTGWSLAVPRPGAGLSNTDAQGNTAMIRESTGPDGKSHFIGKWVDPDFPLATDFSVPDGSLPRKRFGTTYRFRARSVDLAGHSVDFAPGSPTVDPGGTGDVVPTVSDKVVNRRSDPVKAPVVVITERMKPGESPAILVVRSNYDTPPASIAPTSRHITPPRSSVEMAEELGGLDDALKPGKPVDPTLYDMLKERDTFEFDSEIATEGKVKATGKALAIGPTLPPVAIPPNLPPLAAGQLRTKQPYVPKEYKQQASVDRIEKPDGTLPYLPDMLSRGATMTGLPSTPATASGVRMTAAAVSSPALGSIAKVGVVRVPIAVGKVETVKTIMVDFDQAGQKWYNKRSFKLIVKGIEATDTRLAAHATPAAPKWDSSAHTLTVELPKAEKVNVELSSFTNPADLNLMEVYEWGTRPFVRKTTVARIVGLKQMALPTAVALPTAIKTTMSADVKALVGLSIIGRNWTVTPSDKLKLVHAVRQPLIAPKFTTYTRISRKKDETHGTLIDWMPIHGKSTAKLDVDARWSENVDDPSAGVPKWKDPNGTDTSVAHREKVFNVTVGPSDTTVLDLGLKRVAKPTFTVISALADDPKANAQRHFFGDTHHRLVNYKATATTRFPEFFADDPNAEFTRTSPEMAIHVPSSTRPAPPSVSYVIPLYGWAKTATTSKRLAGGLRVYLNRPWFSSGDNEQLAVVVTPPTTLVQSRYHTQWGDDPIWRSVGQLSTTRPSTSHFQNRAGTAGGLKLAEDGSTASIAAYDVDFDADRDMWFADIRINPGGAYYPFVKLALARFQKYAITGCELSPVTIADFAQLAPERSATVQWVTSLVGWQVKVTVSGQTYSQSHLSKFHQGKRATVTAQFEKQLTAQTADVNSPSGWLPVGSETEMTRKDPQLAFIGGSTFTSWSRSLTFPSTSAGETCRLVIREYEHFHSADSAPNIVGLPPSAARLVYADIIPLTKPPGDGRIVITPILM